MAAGDDLFRKLAAIGRVSQVPDLGFGPMTGDTISGGDENFIPANPSLGSQALSLGEEPARMVVGGFDKASDSAAEAMADPTLSNITAAGINTGAAVMPFSPVGGARMVAGSVLGGGGLSALDAIKDIIIPGAEAKKRPQAAPPIPESKAAAAPAMATDDPVWQKVKDDPELAALYQQIKVTQDAATKEYPGKQLATGERMAAAQRLEKLNAAFTDALAKRSANAKQLFDQKVANANAAREAAMAGDDRFSKTFAGRVYAKTGLGPFIAAAIPSTIVAAAKGPAKTAGQWMGRSLMATAAGAAGANMPAGYDVSFAPPANPEKEAMRRYAYELPDNHPDKDKAAAYAESLPDENPVHTAALKEFDSAPNILKKTAFGGVEGFMGGETGDLFMSGLGGLARAKTYGFDEWPWMRSATSTPARIEPTLPVPQGAFGKASTFSPTAKAAVTGSVPPGPADQISAINAPQPKVSSTKKLMDAASPDSVNRLDLMTGGVEKRGKTFVPVGPQLKQFDALNQAAGFPTRAEIVKGVMGTNIDKSLKKKDIEALVDRMASENPHLDIPDVTKEITRSVMAGKKAPGAMTKALQAKFKTINPPAND